MHYRLLWTTYRQWQLSNLSRLCKELARARATGTKVDIGNMFGVSGASGGTPLFLPGPLALKDDLVVEEAKVRRVFIVGFRR